MPPFIACVDLRAKHENEYTVGYRKSVFHTKQLPHSFTFLTEIFRSPTFFRKLNQFQCLPSSISLTFLRCLLPLLSTSLHYFFHSSILRLALRRFHYFHQTTKLEIRFLLPWLKIVWLTTHSSPLRCSDSFQLRRTFAFRMHIFGLFSFCLPCAIVKVTFAAYHFVRVRTSGTENDKQLCLLCLKSSQHLHSSCLAGMHCTRTGEIHRHICIPALVRCTRMCAKQRQASCAAKKADSNK